MTVSKFNKIINELVDIYLLIFIVRCICHDSYISEMREQNTFNNENVDI